MRKSKILKIFSIATILCTSLLLNPISANANSATSYTYTLNAKGKLIRTQDAYLPDLTITSLGLNKPEDIFVLGDTLYIADTGNKRIVIYSISEHRIINEIMHQDLKQPKGIYVTEENEIYVADSSAKAIFTFSYDGTLINKYGRPTNPAYGNVDFSPKSIAVDKSKNMYIISEGVYNGIIQLSDSGEFLGYFSSNKVQLNYLQQLQNKFFNEEQKKNLINKVPTTFSNIFIDDTGIVYSTTMGTGITNTVKKHNIAGINMFQNSTIKIDAPDFMDIYVDNEGIVYVASKSGLIYVYSSDGDFIYLFGSPKNSQDISGLYSTLSSIAVDDSGRIWTIDSDKAFLQSFTPTEFANNTYKALSLYNEGKYDESMVMWNEVLRLNQMSILAHNGIGKTYLFKQEYEEAMLHFELAGNRSFYSEAFWEVRNIYLQSMLGYVLVLSVLGLIIYKITKFIDKKKIIKKKMKNISNKLLSIKIIDDLYFIFDFIKSPLNAFYDLKIKKKGSVLAASIILLILFIVFIISNIGNDFIFQLIPIEEIDLNALIIGFFIITFTAIICNYLVTSINDGEGTIEEIFKLFMYSMGPYIIATTITIVMSYCLTYNEAFIIDFIKQIGFIWSLINVVLGLQEIHNYNTRNAIKSIIITIVFMIIISIIIIIIFMMGDQAIQFIEAVIKEVIRNVIE